MKYVKLYNVIFPFWLLLFFPPVLFIALIGNFIIDSLVIAGCFFLFRLAGQKISLLTLYKRTIIKVWLLGFLADIAGAGLLLFIAILQGIPGLPYKVTSAVNYDPLSHPLALVIVIIAILVSGLLIFIFNYKFTFAKMIDDKILRIKTALTITIITMPWTFLIPIRWLSVR